MDAKDHLRAVLAKLNRKEFWSPGLDHAVKQAEIFLEDEACAACGDVAGECDDAGDDGGDDDLRNLGFRTYRLKKDKP